MKDLDVVVFGATGYTGRLVAEHLAQVAPDDVRIGLAGRSRARLEQLQAGLGRDWPVLVVEAGDAGRLAESAEVVCTTVGPYAEHGWPLVEACARTGTHYVDITGELLFHRRVIDELDGVARETGATLVPSCGFDSVPSDLVVLVLADQVRADGEGTLTDATVVATIQGGVSGGTVASLRGQVDAAAADPAAAALIADPYSLSPQRDEEPSGPVPPDLAPVSRGRDGAWTGPFVMGQYNSRIVRRSNALQGWAYGKELRYQERMGFGTGLLAPLKALSMTGSLKVTEPAMRFGPTRALLDRVLPSPGEGPSPRDLARGWFRMEVTATTSTGARYTAVIAADQEPYAATAVMVGQSALGLATEATTPPAGVLTPATALGQTLAERLRKQGFELSARRA